MKMRTSQWIVLGLSLLVPVCAQAKNRDLNRSTKDLPTPSGLSELVVTDELAALDDLIRMTELTLIQQKELRKHLVAFRKAEEEYIANPDSNAHVRALVTAGHRLLEKIQEGQLEYLFEQQLIGELNVLSKIATKRNSAL